MATKRNNARFQVRSAVYTCSCCGKATRETGSDESIVELCLRCLLENYAENAASDHGYDSRQAEDARARLAAHDAKAEGGK